MKVAIVTDSNSGITQNEAKKIGAFVLPMPFIIGEDEYFEDINLTQEEFYQKLLTGDDISTSQPAIGQVTEFWDKILKDYDEIVHMAMSSGLSESCNTAKRLAEDYNGRVQVVDNHRISVTQKQATVDALNMAKDGYNAKEIKEYLEATAKDSSIYIMVDTLKYLKKGGRLTPAVAAIGTLLKIKPVLQIQGGKLDTYAKVMSVPAAKIKMIAAIKHDLETRFADLTAKGEMCLEVAFTNCRDKAEAFREEIEKEIPNVEMTFVDPLSLSVACHIGSGALAVACSRKYISKTKGKK